MASDPSNARDALRDQAESSEKLLDSSSVSGNNLQSGKTAQARVMSEPPPSALDSEDEGRALLSELTIGTVIDGKYRVDEVLGRGAMGVVVAAMHEQLGERVALKFLRYRAKGGAGSGGDDFQSRFKREARVSAKLKNEHITRVIDVGVWHEKVPYMVMDYLVGLDLRQVIKAQGPLPVGVALDYVVQICTGIAEAHANGIVHRDLKPSNLFVTRRPDGSDIVKVLDFGISKWSAGESEVDELTQTGVVLGSPKYMSPEQLFGSSEVDSRADVWSIGAILYEMLCGRPPFDLPTFTKICAELATDRMPPSLHERRPDVSPELDAVVMRCFLRDPGKRMPNVAELAGAVLDAVQAPFSTQVRQKIAAMLDPKGTRDALATSSGRVPAMSTGSYPALLAGSLGTTGVGAVSGRSIPVDTLASARSTSSAPRMASSLEASSDSERNLRRRSVGWVVAAGVALLAGVLFYTFAGHNKADDGRGAAATGSAVASTTSTATAKPAVAATATDSAAAQATTTPAQPSASASASATATSETVARPVHAPSRGGGSWRPQPVHNPPPPTPPAATTPSAPPPPPVATTPPAPTQKVDPLGDRQ